MSNPEDLIAGLLMIGWLLGIHVGMAGLFHKVGIPAWHAFIPILNGYQLCRTAGVHGGLMLAVFIPLANLAFVLYVGLRLSQRFGYPDWFGVALGFSGLGLLPVVAFCSREVTMDTRIGQNQRSLPTEAAAPDDVRSRRSAFVILLVLSMVQLVCLLCVPGLMIVGAMALGGVGTITPAMEFSILIAALLPVTVLGALVGQWIGYSTRRYKLAMSMSAVPLLNLLVFIASVPLVFGG
ncbi:MAG: DUF5684 domain-containing protein [Planctomycetota bacterium]